jgi:hypothetical protein
MNQNRIFFAYLGSLLTLGAGIYCVFLTMAFPNFLFAIIGTIMFVGTIAMRKQEQRQTGAIVILFSIVVAVLLMNHMIFGILGDKTISIGSGPNDYLTFSIIERFILILIMLIAVPCALIGGVDGLLGNETLLTKLYGLKLPQITYLISSALTIFSIGWAAFYIYIVRTFLDSLIFFPIFIGLLILFYYGWWTLNRGKNPGFAAVFFGICAFFFAFLTLLNFFYFVIAVLNIFSLGALMTATKPVRTNEPQGIKRTMIRSAGLLIMLAFVVGIILIPMQYKWDANPIKVVVSDHSKDIIEINWAYGSEMSKDWDWLARPDVVSMINYVNANQSRLGVNISVTVPLVKEIFEEPFASDVALILTTLYANNVTVDLMPIVDSAILGDRDEYIHDDNIEDFKKVYHLMKDWIHDYGLEGMYRSLVIDLERTTTIKINELVLNWMSGQNGHILGQKKLIDFMDELRANGEKVSGAFFGFHIFDFVDLDDAQQDFFMISIVPPNNWEYIAAMIYQSGRGSNYSVYSYCQDMNYHFGDRAVPYAVTMHSSYDDVLTRLRIMKNSGFNKIGMWAMHELFADGTLFGMSGHKNATPSRDPVTNKEIPDPWTAEMFIQLHEDLAADGDVEFMFDGFQSENSYEMLTLVLDLWLYRRPVYTHGWPIMGKWIYPNNFVLKTVVTVFCFGVMAAVTAIMPILIKRKSKQKAAPIA